MQCEIVIKGDRWCSCYTCLPRTAPAATQTGRKTAAPGTGTGAPPVAQRLLTITWPKTRHNINIHAYNSKKLRNSTSIYENSKQNYARTILRVTMIVWT